MGVELLIEFTYACSTIIALGGSISSDIRNYHVHRLKTMGVAATIARLYPRMFALHDLTNTIALPDQQTGWIQLPSNLRLSYTMMEADGAYYIGEIQTMASCELLNKC